MRGRLVRIIGLVVVTVAIGGVGAAEGADTVLVNHPLLLLSSRGQIAGLPRSQF